MSSQNNTYGTRPYAEREQANAGVRGVRSLHMGDLGLRFKVNIPFVVVYSQDPALHRQSSILQSSYTFRIGRGIRRARRRRLRPTFSKHMLLFFVPPKWDSF